MIKHASISDHAHGQTLAAANDDSQLGALTSYSDSINKETTKEPIAYFSAGSPVASSTTIINDFRGPPAATVFG
jgi:hypothetical protein